MANIGKVLQGMNRLTNLNLEHAIRMPEIHIPRMPTPEEQHVYESAGALIRRLAVRIRLWQRQIPKDAQPVILAILANGASIRVSRLIQDGHNGIIVEGTLNDSPCMVLAHQGTLQLLCYVEQMQEPEKEKIVIGFQYQGKEQDDESQQPGAG